MDSIPTWPLFDLGHVVVTPGAEAALRHADEDLEFLLDQYQHGYWGSLSRGDRFDNAHAIESGSGRIQGRYALWTHEMIYVTTEPNRCTTTVMLPEEW